MRRFGLGGQPDALLFGAVTRLTSQKGMDLLLAALPEIIDGGGMLVLLGSGDGNLEAGFAAAAENYRGRVGVMLGYDEALSHLIIAGSDSIVVPSRFEPCGLTQLYGLRYGCVPLVSRVGGLADTVIDANEAAVEAGVATGIVFAPATADAFLDAIHRAIRLFGREKIWRKMQRRGMKSDVSWDLSAEKYATLYDRVLGVTKNDDNDN